MPENITMVDNSTISGDNSTTDGNHSVSENSTMSENSTDYANETLPDNSTMIPENTTVVDNSTEPLLNETVPETSAENETSSEGNETTSAANETAPATNETSPVANETTPAVNETTPAANETVPSDNTTDYVPPDEGQLNETYDENLNISDFLLNVTEANLTESNTTESTEMNETLSELLTNLTETGSPRPNVPGLNETLFNFTDQIFPPINETIVNETLESLQETISNPSSVPNSGPSEGTFTLISETVNTPPNLTEIVESTILSNSTEDLNYTEILDTTDHFSSLLNESEIEDYESEFNNTSELFLTCPNKDETTLLHEDHSEDNHTEYHAVNCDNGAFESKTFYELYDIISNGTEYYMYDENCWTYMLHNIYNVSG